MHTLAVSEREVGLLWKEYIALDTDRKGLTPEQMGALPQLKYNPIGHQLIKALTSEKAKKGERISFKDFVLSMAVFAPEARRDTKLKFAFKAFDDDEDGVIGPSDLLQLLKSLTPPAGSEQALDDKVLQSIVQKTLEEADTDRDGFLGYDEFVKVLEGTDFYARLTINLT